MFPTPETTQFLRCSALTRTLLLLLAACGGTYGAVQAPDSGDQDVDEIGPCSALPVAAVSASASLSGYPASNAIDGTRSTRWAADGQGVTLTADLGQAKNVCAINIAWLQGRSRIYDFAVALSNDGNAFTTVFTGQNNGNSSALQTYDFPDGVGRFVRITVNGNDVDNVGSITELVVRGTALSSTSTTASFAFSPASPAAGQEVLFDASASSCAAMPCTFTWTDEPAEGGVYPLGTGTTLKFTFQNPGTKSVTLVVTDASGAASRVQKQVIVSSCTPSCSGKVCGPDGCGGSCGTCSSGTCDANGQCVTSCTPSCSGKVCGPDGCGGSCGTCSSGTCDASGQCSAVQTASQVSQYGITWTFDRAYPVGQFINGDWWVVGPVTVVSVSPEPGPAPANEVASGCVSPYGDSGLRDDKTLRNGSMVVMTAKDAQGYDSRGLSYSASTSIRFPYTLEVNRSLISSISNVTNPVQVMHYAIMWSSEQNACRALQTAAVLTSLAAAPPADAFRPTYVGGDKRIFRASSLRWDRLLNLAVSFTVPSWAQYERYLERPWIDHMNGEWTGQYFLPSQNQPSYGRENARILGTASLMLLTNTTQQQKQTLLYRLVQIGIDLRGIVEVGGHYNAGGGHTSGRKWPILFAGLMLDDNYFFSMPSSAYFHEDTQTYWGNGWDHQTALWQMVIFKSPVPQPYFQKMPTTWTSDEQNYDSYRQLNSKAWTGEALAALLMGAKSKWDHNVFFDVEDDWMRETDLYAAYRQGIARPSEETTTWDTFQTNFWRLHRSSVPTQPDGPSSVMWDVNVSGALKWVPNPSP